MPRITTNPFVLGGIEIPGPMVFHILLAWKAMPSSPIKIEILRSPLPPKDFDSRTRYAPNYAICLGCFRIAGHCDGGKLMRQCSKCSHEVSHPGDFWSRIGAYSALQTPWATDRVVCKVIGTVLDFNRGRL